MTPAILRKETGDLNPTDYVFAYASFEAMTFRVAYFCSGVKAARHDAPHTGFTSVCVIVLTARIIRL
jgi:hypothetical protein